MTLKYMSRSDASKWYPIFLSLTYNEDVKKDAGASVDMSGHKNGLSWGQRSSKAIFLNHCIWYRIDKAWSIRQNFNFRRGKCQGHSSKNRSRGHVTNILKIENPRKPKCSLVDCELKDVKLFRYKINSLRAMNRQPQGCSVTSRNCPRLYHGNPCSEKIVATAGFPAHNNPSDRFWAKNKIWGCKFNYFLVDLSWNALGRSIPRRQRARQYSIRPGCCGDNPGSIRRPEHQGDWETVI